MTDHSSSDGQSVEPDREQRSGKGMLSIFTPNILVSSTDEPPAAEDGIEKAPSPTPAPKRRHIEDERAPEAEQLPTAIGKGGTETQQLETLQMRRRRQEDFIMYKRSANNVYYRNSIHVFEHTNNSDTTLGRPTF